MVCEFDIIKQGYLKGFVDGRARRRLPNGSRLTCQYHGFGGADCFQRGYKIGFKRGSSQIQSEGRLKDTVRRYFYRDFGNEIDVQAELALNFLIPIGAKEKQ